MSLSKFVKIGNVSTLSDARYCAGMMVNLLGFEVVDEHSEHYVDAATFGELTEWVAGVAFVGECHNTDLETLEKIVSTYQIQYIELNQLDLLESVADTTDKLLIFHVSVASMHELETLADVISEAASFAELIIVDAVDEIDAEEIEARLSAITVKSKLVRAFHLDTNSVKQLTEDWYGIELKGSPEEKAGYKDYGIVMDILEEIEED